MRLVTAAALVAALAAVPTAQTQYADSAGVYVALQGVSVYNRAVSVGYRLPSGFDYGIQYNRYSRELEFSELDLVEGRFVSSSFFKVGPEVGYTRALSDRVTGRISASVLYTSSRATQLTTLEADQTGYSSYTGRSLASNIAATVSRQVRVAGSFQVQPTVGVFAETRRALYSNFPRVGEPGPQSQAAAGIHLGLPLSFRLLDQDVTFAPYAQIPLLGPDFKTRTYAGGGLRVNF